MTQTPAGWYPVDGGKERYWDGAAWSDQIRDPQPPAPPAPAAPTAPPTGAPVPDAAAYYAPPPTQYAQPEPPKKKRKVFLWFFLAIQVLFIIWIIAGASGGSGNPDPSDCGGLDLKTCNDAQDAGTAIGVGLIIVFWMVVDVILGVIYGVYRLAKRN
jgi:hypothetical protein